MNPTVCDHTPVSPHGGRELDSPPAPVASPFEFSGVQVLADGEGFLLECQDGQARPLRLRLPSQALYQLMRVLPRLEAAMEHARTDLSSAIMAHPVVGWSVERSGLDRDIAFCVRTDKQIESAFTFDIESAKAFRLELSDAIERAIGSPAISSTDSGTR